MKNKVNDYSGQVFGTLTVLKRVENLLGKYAMWSCLCTCGEVVNISTKTLRDRKYCSSSCKNKPYSNNMSDLTGKIFGNLTVIKRDVVNKQGKPSWYCSCKCGGYVSIAASNLVRRQQSCSMQCTYNKQSAKDYSGKIFGRLTVLHRDGIKSGSAAWICSCSCGEHVKVCSSALNNGQKSCGCLLNDISKHSKSDYARNERDMRWYVASVRGLVPMPKDLRVLSLYAEAAKMTRITGERHVVDHIIPRNGKNVSGLHVFENLQVLHWRDNLKKSNIYSFDDIV